MIKFQNITKIYPTHFSNGSPVIILDNVSFEIKDGEFVSIVGKSGAGKTTLIRLLLGLEEPTSGKIFVDNININKINSTKLQKVRRKIGVAYQDYKLLSTKTVYENIAYIMAVKGRDDREITKEVSRVLEIAGLAEKINNFPDELSGGEQQRLAIARAIVSQPDIVVADEPTGNLDPYNTYEIISLLKKVNEKGKTVLLATHNKEIINQLGKRVITLQDGKIVHDEDKGKFIL